MTTRGGRRVALAGSLALTGVLVSGCDWPRFGWPDGVTTQGIRMREFWTGSFIAALIVGVGVWGLMFWAMIAYRKRKNSPLYPKQTKENLPLELAYTAIPFVMIATLFYFTVTTENFVLDKQDNPDQRVSIVGFKWNWQFGYPGTATPTGGEVQTIGTSNEVPILVLPVGRVIQYEQSSKDVIHSFWVPEYLFKRDVFPDPEANNQENIYQNTIERTGAFVGRCAELCGTYHSAMNFEVRALEPALFDQYLGLRQQVNPDTGRAYSNPEALIAVGETNPSCGELCEPRAITTYPLDPNREADTAPQPQAGGG